MIGPRHARSENKALSIHTSHYGLCSEVSRRRRIIFQKPKYAAFNLFEYPHPTIENTRRHFIILVKATKYKTRLRQSQLSPRERPIWNGTPGIVDLIAGWIIAVGQPNDLFRVIPILIFRNNNLIGDNVINEFRPHCSWIAEIADLDRNRTLSKNTSS